MVETSYNKQKSQMQETLTAHKRRDIKHAVLLLILITVQELTVVQITKNTDDKRAKFAVTDLTKATRSPVKHRLYNKIAMEQSRTKSKTKLYLSTGCALLITVQELTVVRVTKNTDDKRAKFAVTDLTKATRSPVKHRLYSTIAMEQSRTKK